MTPGVGRVFPYREISKLMNAVGFVMYVNEKLRLVRIFAVDESRQAKVARCVRGNGVASELVCPRMKQGLRLFDVYSLDLPDDLVFAGRSVENEIGRRCVQRVPYIRQRRFCVLIEVQVYVANFSNVLFCSAAGTAFQRIHSDENIGTGAVLLPEPALKIRIDDCFGRGDALQGLAARAVAQQNRDVIHGLVQGKNVLGRGQPLRFEAPFGAHVSSAFAYITRYAKRSAPSSECLISRRTEITRRPAGPSID